MAQAVAGSRTDRVAGGVLHTSAAAGWDGSALACLRGHSVFLSQHPNVAGICQAPELPSLSLKPSPVVSRDRRILLPNTHHSAPRAPPWIAGLLPDFSVCKSKRCCD